MFDTWGRFLSGRAYLSSNSLHNIFFPHSCFEKHSLRALLFSVNLHCARATVIEKIDSATEDMVEDVENIKNQVEGIYFEPSYHLVYSQTGNQNVESVNDYPEIFKTEDFEIQGDFIKINYRLKIWDIEWGHSIYGNIYVYDETRSHILITSYSIDAQESYETFIGEIPIILEPGTYSIEFTAGIPEYTDYKIEDYDIIIWEYH